MLDDRQEDSKTDSYDYGPAEKDKPIGFMINILPLLVKIKGLFVKKTVSIKKEKE